MVPLEFREAAILGRGRGLSYGDASLNSDNIAVAFDLLDFVESFDRNTGVFTCQAGMTLEEVIRVVLPRQPPIGLLYLLLGRRAVNSQYLVIIASVVHST